LQFGVEVLLNLLGRSGALLLLLVDQLLQLGEVAPEALLDVLDAFEAVLLFGLDVLLDGALLLSDQPRDLLSYLLAVELSSLKPRLEFSLAVPNLLLLSFE